MLNAREWAEKHCRKPHFHHQTNKWIWLYSEECVSITIDGCPLSCVLPWPLNEFALPINGFTNQDEAYDFLDETLTKIREVIN